MYGIMLYRLVFVIAQLSATHNDAPQLTHEAFEHYGSFLSQNLPPTNIIET
jgi:hypothetical protein